MILATAEDVLQLETEHGWQALHDWWNGLPEDDIRKEVHGIIESLMTDLMFATWLDPGHSLTLNHLFDREIDYGSPMISAADLSATMDRLKALTLDQGWYPSYGFNSAWYAVGVPAAVPSGAKPTSADISNFRWGTFVLPGLTPSPQEEAQP